MLRATEMRRAGSFDPAAAADSVALDSEGRHRRRIALRAQGGLGFLLDLAEAAMLRDGDGLALEDGRIVLVKAAPERLLEVTAPDAPTLLRIAWHLGNRHLPAQLLGDRLRIREDHVIAHMIAGLGGCVTALEAPFDPEAGAYGHRHPHGHD